MRLIHISDLHFGAPYRAEVGEALLRSLSSFEADVLVVTGDLTQRARGSQFRSAREFLQKASAIVPQLVVCPGNHDIPLYRFWERLLAPYRKYRRHIAKDIDQVSVKADFCIVSLSSVKPFKHLVEGSLSSSQYSFASRAFMQFPSQEFRIIACHHPPLTDRNAAASTFRDFCQLERVDFVLCGHRHDSMVSRLPLHPKTLILSCGTTTSGRGRGAEREANAFFFVVASQENTRVITYRYSSLQRQFMPYEESHFPRVLP